MDSSEFLKISDAECGIFTKFSTYDLLSNLYLLNSPASNLVTWLRKNQCPKCL